MRPYQFNDGEGIARFQGLSVNVHGIRMAALRCNLAAALLLVPLRERGQAILSGLEIEPIRL
jgi:hypothetical protein